MLQDKQAKEEGGEGGKSQNTGWTAGARPTGVQRDVASGAAGGFIGHQPVTVTEVIDSHVSSCRTNCGNQPRPEGSQLHWWIVFLHYDKIGRASCRERV